VIVDGHLDIAWNAIAEGRGFDRPAPRGYQVCRAALEAAGIGLVFPTIFTAPVAALKHQPASTLVYRTPGEAHLVGRLQVGFYRAAGLQLIRSQAELRRYRRAWRPGRLAGVLLMEGADPIERPAQLAEWVELGVRVIGPAWMRTRYCGGTDQPGGLTADGRRLLALMHRLGVILDLSHMADRAMRDSFEAWRGPLVATHAGARALTPGQRQLPDWALAEIGRRDGVAGISFYSGHVGRDGKATAEDLARHALHFARLAGDPRHVGIGSDMDGGFGVDKAALRLSGFGRLRRALARHFSPGDVDGILGGNWLRYLEANLPA